MNKETNEIQVIVVEGSESRIYSNLLKHTPANDHEKSFLKDLKYAINAGVGTFKVPICAPSIAEDGSLQFVKGYKPATGYTYEELEELAADNDVNLGTVDQYILFVATMIHRLIEDGWYKEEAFYAICNDSKRLGRYYDCKLGAELTGTRMVAGMCDLTSSRKILRRYGSQFWIVTPDCLSVYWPTNTFGIYQTFGVGWFVL